MTHIPTSFQFGDRDTYLAKLEDKKMFSESDCPLCARMRNDDGILWKGQSWCVLFNKYPYIDGGKHIMAIPIVHLKKSIELSGEQASELPQLQNFIASFYGDEDYFSFTRESFGDRSVEHLHTHFLPGSIGQEDMRYILRKKE